MNNQKLDPPPGLDYYYVGDQNFIAINHYEKLKQENLALHEKVSALESREVCGAAHENVETCGYCQRDGLLGLIQLLSHNTDIPEHVRRDMLTSHRYIDATNPPLAQCRIREHDGAYKCYTHNKVWGAITNPDVPCIIPDGPIQQTDKPL